MAGESTYITTWLIYLASSVVFLLVLWKFTALIGRLPRWFLRIFVATLIYTPVLPRSDEETAVPALMVAAMDAIAFGPAAAARGLAALATGMIVAFAGAIIVSLGLFIVRRKLRS